MKTPVLHKRSILKKIVIISVATLLLPIGYFGVAYGYSLWPFVDTETPTYQPATQEEIDTGNSIKENNLEDTDKPAGDTTTLPEPTDPGNGEKPSVDMEVTATSIDGGYLRVRTLIQTVTNSGMCELILEKPGATPYTLSADVQALANSTTCQGFDIPVSSLSTGTWNMTISFQNETIQASTTKQVTIP